MNIVDIARKKTLFPMMCIITFCIFMGLSGCSSDTPNLKNDGQIPDSNQILSSICTNWFSSSSEVEKQMKGYNQFSSSSEFIGYAPSDNSFDFGYSFVDDKLVSAVALFPMSEDTDVNETIRKYKIDSYDFMGILNGYRVYMNDKSNTMATVSSKHLQDIDFMAIGFAPINGNEALQDVRPITVETLEATSITTTSMVLNGNFDCDDEISECRFIVSANQDMSDKKSFKASRSGNTFYYKLNNLDYNSTIYFQAVIISEEEAYAGDVMCAELEKIQTYSIGDLYPNEYNPVGVVCAVKDGGVHGTIISLDQDYLKWDERGMFCHDYNSYNRSDGSANQMGSVQPFHKWIKSHGDGWFGPAINQLKFSSSNLKKINKTLESNGFKKLDGMYWSSTQYDCNTAWVVTVTESSYMGYSNQHYFYNSKDQNRQTRAMKYY